MLPQISYAKTYSVRVRGFVGGTWGSYGAECNVTTPAFPTTSLQSVCGTTIPSRYTQLFITAVLGASDYEYEFTDVNTSAVFTKLRGNNQINFYLYMAPQAGINKTYNVRVRAIVGGVTGSYGSVCTITTPPTMARLAGDGYPELEEQNAPKNKTDLAAEPSVKFNVYPNPNGGLFNLEISSAENMTFELYDALGRTVIKEKLISTMQSYDISGKESGIYYIRITQNNALLYSTRLIKRD
jgi:hypothetical protein